MPKSFKLSAFLILVMSVLFFLFFEISKHDPVFSHVNAFAEDPYDGIGSMGIQAAAMLAALSLLRVFWPYRTNEISENQKALIARTQMMAVLAVGITLAADAIAMLRYRQMWAESIGGRLLAMLLAGLAFLTAIAGSLVYRLRRRIALPTVPHHRTRIFAVSFATVLTLAFYPADWRQGVSGALFTALLGGVLLFLPVWAFGTALVPFHVKASQEDAAMSVWRHLRKYQWSLVLLAGVLTGFSLALRELWNPGGWPPLTGRIIFVISVYIALETAGLLIGYVLLRKPLGLFLQNSQHS
ncbi:MAG: hypothetical protein ACYCOR_06965 [Acidobacteriaceae bacterium]